ncbi:MAG: hypothetical protein WBL61_18560 [Bryobacteraceae bacterium]
MITRWMLLPLFAACLAGAEPRHAGMVMSWTNPDTGLAVVTNTWCEPPVADGNPFACLGANEIQGGIGLHPYGHIISARQSKTWFGYAFNIEKTGKGDGMRLSIGPAAATAGPAGFTQVPLPKYDAGPFTIEPGDIVRIPLLVNPNTGQTLIDEIQIFTHPVDTNELFADSAKTEAPRDFALRDVEMTWLDGTLFVNKKQVKTVGGGATGTVVWYSYEGIGTVVMTFLPQSAPGFQKAGVISGRTLKFTVGSNEYEWRCKGPILPGDGEYNLYVHFDPRALKPGSHGSSSGGEAAVKGILDNLAAK